MSTSIEYMKARALVAKLHVLFPEILKIVSYESIALGVIIKHEFDNRVSRAHFSRRNGRPFLIGTYESDEEEERMWLFKSSVAAELNFNSLIHLSYGVDPESDSKDPTTLRYLIQDPVYNGSLMFGDANADIVTAPNWMQCPSPEYPEIEYAYWRALLSQSNAICN